MQTKAVLAIEDDPVVKLRKKKEALSQKEALKQPKVERKEQGTQTEEEVKTSEGETSVEQALTAAETHDWVRTELRAAQAGTEVFLLGYTLDEIEARLKGVRVRIAVDRRHLMDGKTKNMMAVCLQCKAHGGEVAFAKSMTKCYGTVCLLARYVGLNCPCRSMNSVRSIRFTHNVYRSRRQPSREGRARYLHCFGLSTLWDIAV